MVGTCQRSYYYLITDMPFVSYSNIGETLLQKDYWPIQDPQTELADRCWDLTTQIIRIQYDGI
jgi:hypothetical protein